MTQNQLLNYEFRAAMGASGEWRILHLFTILWFQVG
jgi:hypothetical protein